MHKRFSSGKFIVPKRASDAGERCLRILKSVGSRAKNLNYLGELFRLITSTRYLRGTAVAPSLWIVSRYFKDNQTMISVDAEFETVWGWRACEISETWRNHNESQKLEAGQTQKELISRGSSGRTIGRPGAISLSSSIVLVDDSDNSPRQSSSSMAPRHPGDSDRLTLPSLKAVGLLDSFESRRTNPESRSALPPLSKAREW